MDKSGLMGFEGVQRKKRARARVNMDKRGIIGFDKSRLVLVLWAVTSPKDTLDLELRSVVCTVVNK